MGWITLPENVNAEELYHHGIKGQKWGVRRFQNPDGTLTSAGKKRYLSGKTSRNNAGAAQNHQALQDHMQATQAAQQAHAQAVQNHQALQDHMQATQAAQQAHAQAVQNHQMMFNTSPMMYGTKDKKKSGGLFKKKDEKPKDFKSKSLNREDFDEEEIQKALMSGDPAEIQKVVSVLSMDEYKYAMDRVKMNKELQSLKNVKDDQAWKKTEKTAKRAKQAVNATIYTYDTIKKFDEMFGLGIPLFGEGVVK